MFPRIVQEPPTATTGYTGGSIRLGVGVGNAEPYPLIAWQYRGKAAISSSDSRFTVLPQGVLQINDLQASNQGQIRAVIKNPKGSNYITSDYVPITVKQGKAFY